MSIVLFRFAARVNINVYRYKNFIMRFLYISLIFFLFSSSLFSQNSTHSKIDRLVEAYKHQLGISDEGGDILIKVYRDKDFITTVYKSNPNEKKPNMLWLVKKSHIIGMSLESKVFFHKEKINQRVIYYYKGKEAGRYEILYDELK